eukprot:Stramenopile-MAST_4_protein_5967
MHFVSSILLGCDYVGRLPTCGPVKAHSVMMALQSRGPVLPEAVCTVLREFKLAVPASYDRLFRRAWLTFHHTVVHDAAKQRRTHLTPVPVEVQQYVGEYLGVVGVQLRIQ